MIVTMKKVTVLCLKKDQRDVTAGLQDLGVLHVVPEHPPAGESVEDARRKLEDVNRVLAAFESVTAEASSTGKPVEEIIDAGLALLDKQKQMRDELSGLQREAARLEPYGDLEPESVTSLKEKGIDVRFFYESADEPAEWPEKAVLIPLRQDKKGRFLAVISTEPYESSIRELPLPEQSLKAVNQKIDGLKKELSDSEAALATLAGSRDVLEAYRKQLTHERQRVEAEAAMGAAQPVSYLRGYVPENSVDALRKKAQQDGWGIVVEDVANDDQPPTLIQNPKWVNLINPVFDFMGIVPGYREVDISALFLLFFSLFFGMIVGDAGYGALFLIFAIAGRKMLSKASPWMVPLLIVMSCCTIIWGLLTGVIFGLDAIPAVFERFRIEWLTDNDNVMYLCFLIGAVHLTLAHGWSAIRMMNRPQALAQVGWVCNTWAMWLLVNSMVLGAPLPKFLVPLFVTGVVLIVVFMVPLNRIKDEWFNYIMLPLDLISNGVDVISYVRLFAVGLATFAVGNAFNNMALSGEMDSWLAGLGAAVVLFLGHSLNIIMAAMSVMVHGLRLNALEFSGHLGMEWSGQAYTPLSKKDD